MQELISRKQAKLLGLRFYFTGKPCKNSHISMRVTVSANCVTCLENYRKDNSDKLALGRKKYREENKEKEREYYIKNKDKITNYKKQWYADNIEYAKEKSRENYTENSEKKKAYQREYTKKNKETVQQSKIRYYNENKEEIKLKNNLYRQNNPHMRSAADARRKASELNATPPWANIYDIRKIYKLAKKLTKSTGVQHSVDHIVPLQGKTVCGLHCEANLRVITLSENASKQNRYWPNMP